MVEEQGMWKGEGERGDGSRWGYGMADDQLACLQTLHTTLGKLFPSKHP